jgi:hypothetical protein
MIQSCTCAYNNIEIQIEADGTAVNDERETRLFPDKDQEDQKITCHDLTQEFLIYATDVSALNVTQESIIHLELLFQDWLDLLLLCGRLAICQ